MNTCFPSMLSKRLQAVSFSENASNLASLHVALDGGEGKKWGLSPSGLSVRGRIEGTILAAALEGEEGLHDLAAGARTLRAIRSSGVIEHLGHMTPEELEASMFLVDTAGTVLHVYETSSAAEEVSINCRYFPECKHWRGKVSTFDGSALVRSVWDAS